MRTSIFSTYKRKQLATLDTELKQTSITQSLRLSRYWIIAKGGCVVLSCECTYDYLSYWLLSGNDCKVNYCIIKILKDNF